VRLLDGTVRLGEVHWYEAHGIGRKEFKLKLPFLSDRFHPVELPVTVEETLLAASGA